MAKSSKSATPKAPPAGFDLTQIHVVEASFLDCIISTEIPATGFVLAARFEVLDLLAVPSFDVAAGRIYYTLSLGVESSDAASTPTGATGFFRLHFAFQVDNLADYIQNDPEHDGPFPTADLMAMLGGVAYATTRGMLFGKTAGTPLNGFALPLLSPQQLFQESIEKLMAEPPTDEAPPKAVTKKAAKESKK